MPLEKGDTKEAISHNVEVEENAGKPHEQAVAIALHTAKDEEPTYKPVCAMTVAEVAKKNEDFWKYQQPNDEPFNKVEVA